MPARWLYFLIEYFTLALLFQEGIFKNLSFTDGKSLIQLTRRTTSSRIIKDRIWDFFRIGDFNFRKIKQNKSQVMDVLISRDVSLYHNKSLENRDEDLVSIRDLDNLFLLSNKSDNFSNDTLDNYNFTDPNLNFSKQSVESEVTQYLDVDIRNSSKENASYDNFTVSTKHIAKVNLHNDRYLSLFSVGPESSDYVREETEVTLDRGSPYVSSDKPETDPWPVKLSAEVAGDLIIGGLMMVHEREDSVTCGPIMPQGGIQALETMLYTLDVINSQPHRPFTLGAHILDDCDKDTYGLEMAVDFIKGKSSN